MIRFAACVLAVAAASAAMAADLSPADWNKDLRENAEKQEAQSWTPPQTRAVTGKGGTISATVSPIAVRAGLEALDHGGNAADAAATVALTQIATQLGSVVSYAGIMTLVYYDAKTGKVVSLDAGYDSYRGETEPKSIPQNDLSLLTGAPAPAPASDLGRQTLVPGFMAGIDAMHARLGRLPFSDLFAPAIYYAEHGVKVSPALAYMFAVRQKVFARTEEGTAFLHQVGNDLPKAGDLYRQPELARTLREVAGHGAGYMYTGDWARAFVAAVRREGGKVAAY